MELVVYGPMSGVRAKAVYLILYLVNTPVFVSMMVTYSCRCGRFWWRRKCRTKYRGPWWRWPAVSISVTFSQVHDCVSVDTDDNTQWSDTTLCHATQHSHLVEVDQLCYSSDSTLYSKMPVGM